MSDAIMNVRKGVLYLVRDTVGVKVAARECDVLLRSAMVELRTWNMVVTRSTIGEFNIPYSTSLSDVLAKGTL